MKARNIVLYLHVHQPFRIRPYKIFDIGQKHDYFLSEIDLKSNNQQTINKVAQKSYLPTNAKLLELLNKHPEFKLSLSITGTLLEQLELWTPEVLISFQDLVRTGRVEILAETYHHSLAFFYSKREFEVQVDMHKQKIERLFSFTPKVFRNTELAYNNELASWADKNGYTAILAEGWDKILGWRNANYVYKPVDTNHIKLLLKNYKLSDDIAFRFGDRNWAEWPLTATKFVDWLESTPEASSFNLFMDYETFGEHQWSDTGIFEFLSDLPKQWLRSDGHGFMTVSELADSEDPADTIDVPQTVTWADTERDLSAWTGNDMQQEAISALYSLEDKLRAIGDVRLIEEWRKLQTSDHFYYMCTKWFNDGDIHAYFSPYDSPYDAFISFMNVWHDLKYRLSEKGIEA
ncbi:MAG: glycoside hydrolase family 57 protein [Candidatus Saccharimonadales bacterium]